MTNKTARQTALEALEKAMDVPDSPINYKQAVDMFKAVVTHYDTIRAALQPSPVDAAKS